MVLLCMLYEFLPLFQKLRKTQGEVTRCSSMPSQSGDGDFHRSGASFTYASEHCFSTGQSIHYAVGNFLPQSSQSLEFA
jgi:hypothetical protein